MNEFYKVPQHSIAVSAYVENHNKDVLLVKTHLRSDTWELPGGYVEEGEALDAAVCREFFEETSIVIRPIGFTGIYYITSFHMLSVVFHAEYVSGHLRIQPEEINQAEWVHLDERNIDDYITRPHMKSRAIDAMRHHSYALYETWKSDPLNLLGRLEVGGNDDK